MGSNTGLAVGLAVGIPCFLAIVIVFALWYRSSQRFKEEFENKSPEDGLDDERDLDLDQIVNSHIAEYTPENTNSDLTDTKENEKGTLTSKKYLVRKQSKVMGLKLVPNEMANRRQSQQPQQQQQQHVNSGNIASSSDTNSFVSNTGNYDQLDTKGQRNFSTYYESVIPILPPQALGSNNNSQTHSTNSPPNSPKIARTNSDFSLYNSADPSKTTNDKEYIRQLHKQDSSSFPQTAYTLGNATPSAINLMNNYYPSSPITSATNSSMNLLNGSKRHASSDLLSSSARGSNQSLLMLGVTSNKKESEKTPSYQGDEKHGQQEQHEHSNESPEKTAEIPLGKPPSISHEEDNDKFGTPFDTPPRESQYLSQYPPYDVRSEYNNSTVLKTLEDSQEDHYEESSLDHDEIDMDVKMPEEAQEYYSNYKNNKREWLASLSGQKMSPENVPK